MDAALVDDADLRTFVCIPGTKGVNVQHLSYQRPDGTEFAYAQRHSKGFLRKLARYTGMDQTGDRAILFHPMGGEEPAFKILCQALDRTTGSTGTIEYPVGTGFGAIRLGDDRYVFDLPDGERVGQVSRPSEEDGTRLVLGREDKRVGRVLPTRPASEDVSVLDTIDEIAEGGSDVGIQGWTSAYKAVTVELDTVPDGALRLFIIAFPICLALGFKRPGEWDKPTEAGAGPGE